MNTPIADFVKAYASSGTVRLHMPGHKGRPFLGCEPYDITEVHGADVLYSAEGIIHQSECNASALFGTAHSFYSTEGSSLAIRAMLALAASGARRNGRRPLVLAARNVHKAFVYACALLDLDVEWLYPETYRHLCSCEVSAGDIARAIALAERRPAAVYVTSPDYLGHMLDIGGIAGACRAAGIPLLVDNAHGAYLNFLPEPLHPMRLGATMCCDSAHKTLPVLTGGAYLHLSHDAPAEWMETARNMLSVFASTSPSYLILQSLDLCNRYLAEGYTARLAACIKRTGRLKTQLAALGYVLEDGEPLKIVIDAARSGRSGVEISEYLRGCGIEAEYSDDSYLVMMLSPETDEADFARIEAAFLELPVLPPLDLAPPRAPQAPARRMSIREAIFGPRRIMAVEDAEGRTCASPMVSCPPAVPVVISGEEITHDAVGLFRRYGIARIEVADA